MLYGLHRLPIDCLYRNARIPIPIFNIARTRFFAEAGGRSDLTKDLEDLSEKLKANKRNLMNREQLDGLRTRKKWAHIFEDKMGKMRESMKSDWGQVFRHYNSYPTNTLLVANLPYDALPDDLLQAFKAFSISSIQIGVNESEYTQGYAHVEFESVAEAADVLAIDYDFYCKGRRLDLYPSRPANKALYDFLPPSDTLHIRYFTKNLRNIRSIIKKVLYKQKQGVVDFFEVSGNPSKIGYIQFETEEQCQAALKTIREYCASNPEDSRLLVMFSTLERPKLGDKLAKWTEDEGTVLDVSFGK